MAPPATGALPVLYSFRRCPYAMRARLAVAASGQPCEHREVLLRDKPSELLAASPKGTVPVLVLPSGEVIDQSLAIMQWALQRHDPHGWLAPDAASPGEMLALVALNDGPFKRHLDRYKYPHRYPEEHGGDPQALAQASRAAAAEHLGLLATRLAAKDWLCGRSASLADMAILPFVRQFAHTDAVWFAAQPWPALAAWLARFETSALYDSVMVRQPRWQGNSARAVDVAAAAAVDVAGVEVSHATPRWQPLD